MSDPVSNPPRREKESESPEALTLLLRLFRREYWAAITLAVCAVAVVTYVFKGRTAFDEAAAHACTPMIEAHANAEDKVTTAIQVTNDEQERHLQALDRFEAETSKALVDIGKSLSVLSDHDDARFKRGR